MFLAYLGDQSLKLFDSFNLRRDVSAQLAHDALGEVDYGLKFRVHVSPTTASPPCFIGTRAQSACWRLVRIYLWRPRMAVNKPVGDNARKGAVRKRSQLKNKLAGSWTKRSKKSGESWT